MYLDSSSADVELAYSESKNVFEIWWLTNRTEILALSSCPENHPSVVIHTMPLEDAVEELSQLIDNGWEFIGCSSDFRKYCDQRILSRLRE